MSPFQYQPLDLLGQEIRLVTLAPRRDDADDGGRVQCKLSTISLGQRPKYEALSYTWGEDTRKKAIFLEGEPFMVSDNLRLALQELSHPSEERVLWIDFICINQYDVTEKNHQVAQMRDIYSNASRVLVWLGEADPFSDSLFAALSRPDPQNQQAAYYGRDSILPIKFWAEYLAGREYWTRLWIIQELALASDILVVCGSDSVEWEVLSPWFGVGSLTHRLDAVRRDKQSQRSCALIRLLKDFRDAKCKDPKDLVYGLLGLATDSFIEELPIDYSKSIYEMYSDLMLWANHRDNANIVAFSVQVQTSLDPFYKSNGLRHWQDSSHSRSQYIRIAAKRVGSWSSLTKLGKYPHKPEPERTIRLYAVEADIALDYPKGAQPDILITPQTTRRLSILQVPKHLRHVQVFTPSQDDIVYEFPYCFFSLIVQAEKSDPGEFGRGFIAWEPTGFPRTPVAPEDIYVSPGLIIQNSDPANTYLYPHFHEPNENPETLFEMDICSFQLLTNQQRRWRQH